MLPYKSRQGASKARDATRCGLDTGFVCQRSRLALPDKAPCSRRAGHQVFLSVHTGRMPQGECWKEEAVRYPTLSSENAPVDIKDEREL